MEGFDASKPVTNPELKAAVAALREQKAGKNTAPSWREMS